MTRLPPALMPLWPAAKRVHRAATRSVGAITRRTAGTGPRSLPAQATTTPDETAAADPQHVTVHAAGPAEDLDRAVPVGRPAGLAFWDEVRRHDVPARFVLEVSDGRLVGDYAATVTPAGVLDGATSPYFGIRDWREHPIFLRPRLPEPLHLSGTVASLASHASGANYYHSLMDTLPRWGILQDAMPGLAPDHLVVAHHSRWDQQLLALAGLDHLRLVTPRKDLCVRADRLVVPSLGNRATLAPRYGTRWLREHLPPRDVSDKPRRLYVTRGTTRNTRRLVDEDALLALLRPLGFSVFDPGAVSVQDQIDHFAAAEVVVAPHGAGLANLNFSPEGVRVLELFAPRYLNPGYWAITDNIADSVYRYLVADPVEPDRPERRMNRVQADIDLEPRAIVDALEELLAA